MAEEMTPEQMLELQKQNCIFCKMVKGEMQAKKVYEDDQILAILDINPAHKGHLLVMPKEHYPILPLVPPPTMRHMFLTTKKLMTAMRSGLIVPRVTMLIANGAAAGQRSPHFLYHLIPREEGDGLDNLDLQKLDTPQRLPEKAQQGIKQLLVQLMGAQAVQRTADPEEAKQQLAMIIEQNPQLKQLIIKNPGMVTQYVQQSPELSVLFEGVDINALSERLKEQEKTATIGERTQQSNPPAAPPQPENSAQTADKRTDDVPDAATLSDEALLAYLEQKPKLKQMLLETPEQLETMRKSNQRVAAFFRSVPVMALAERVKQLLGAQETTEMAGVDFDMLSEYLSKEEKDGS